MSQRTIELRGVSTNNLRQVDLDLAHRQFVVFCGVSGSGKTSMALDTLYAEGQRRYIESFSPYTRQFLEQLDKPPAERITGIPPAIAVTHKNPSRSNRATIGTTTEINDYLSVLFARLGQVVCTGCGQSVERDSPESIAQAFATLPDGLRNGLRMMVGFGAVVPRDEPIETWLADLIALGYVRGVHGGTTQPIGPALAKELSPGESLTIVLDRLTTSDLGADRLRDSLEAAYSAGDGSCTVLLEHPTLPSETLDEEMGNADKRPAARHPTHKLRRCTIEPIDNRRWRRYTFSAALRCDACGIDYPDPEPLLFNFNRPLGACPECEGFGNIVTTDMARVVPDPSKSLREGAIAPWNSPSYAHELQELLALAKDYHLRVDVPFSDLNDDERRIVIEGIPERKFGGLNGFMHWLERRKYKMHLRAYLSRWRSYRPCPKCGGDRLRPEALAVQIAGRNFAELSCLNIADALQLLENLPERMPEWQRSIARPLLADVSARLSYLVEVGVGYLTLDRPLRTLSGGETQRVALTTTLGSNLVDMLYVLDEPSVGLHPADVGPLAAALLRLKERGNTVVAVEHEETILRRADQVVEFGPGAGSEGGCITFQGTSQALERNRESRTGNWLSGRSGLRIGSTRRPTQNGWVKLRGARGNNLRNITAEFPLGVLCLVTGVSGAGKSTLVGKTLYPALLRALHRDTDSAEFPEPLDHDEVLGAGQLNEVLHIDQSPIGRSPRSNPATYLKAFDPIRSLFAEQAEARSRGLTAGHFSFNVDGGRCEQCRGDGFLSVDMQFMANVYMKCPECGGKRFRPQVLEVKYRGLSIADVLDHTAREAFTFFRGQRKIQTQLKHLLDVGLDYLRLGQPATTLSGGEAQRLKLAAHLAAKRRGRTLFLLDEPTIGLHYSDIVRLLDCFDALLEVGHSLVLIEHNVQLMLAADWLIDLGPGGADRGGSVVASGTPEDIAKCGDSATGTILSAALARAEHRAK
ncbi:MAG: excinuclease ABC subunit UvrA [Pirellulales bacterium]|nr:excinuclease ABC subunit UvrA [Pirellulales bacterium]